MNFLERPHCSKWSFSEATILRLIMKMRGKWQPTPVFLPGEFHGERSMASYSPWGRKESDTTKHSTMQMGM